MRRSLPLFALLALFPACASTYHHSVDAHQRAHMLDPVKTLVGTWEGKGEGDSKLLTRFDLSSNGTVVREIMFAGTPHEMTNMYHLDGNDLVMTHYCAQGNQPRLRATSTDGHTIAFAFDSVTDRKSADELTMSEMKLEIVDKDHMNEHWKAFEGDKLNHEMVMRFTRVH